MTESNEAHPKPWSIQPYIAIARIDHWLKNIFMLPGAALAIVLSTEPLSADTLIMLVLGILATSLIASANYTINEWLDADFDRHHPTKQYRPAASGNVSEHLVWAQWFVLAAVGLLIAASIGSLFLTFTAALLMMGLVYNVQPIRAKDRVYLDVLLESFNNPLRFMLGWTVVINTTLPPSSAIMAYWMGGAFLMAIKRYAEYRFIADPVRAGRYRRSFFFYTEEMLLLSAFFYAISSSLFLGVFLIKYQIEFLLLFPFIAALFVWYFHIGLQADSVAQRPEELYKEWEFMVFVGFLGVLIVVLFFVDLPWMSVLVEHHVLSGTR